jgi:predicted enzyme related to lactoylglutathione lyase
METNLVVLYNFQKLVMNTPELITVGGYEPMKPRKIELSWITVSDLKKAKNFYTEILGMKVHESNEEYGWLEVQGVDGGALLGIAQASDKEPMKAGSNAVVNITVDDIEASIYELRKKNVTFVGEILEIPGQVKMITFTDADKNHFQLVECLSH